MGGGKGDDGDDDDPGRPRLRPHPHASLSTPLSLSLFSLALQATHQHRRQLHDHARQGGPHVRRRVRGQLAHGGQDGGHGRVGRADGAAHGGHLACGRRAHLRLRVAQQADKGGDQLRARRGGGGRRRRRGGGAGSRRAGVRRRARTTTTTTPKRRRERGHLGRSIVPHPPGRVGRELEGQGQDGGRRVARPQQARQRAARGDGQQADGVLVVRGQGGKGWEQVGPGVGRAGLLGQGRQRAGRGPPHHGRVVLGQPVPEQGTQGGARGRRRGRPARPAPRRGVRRREQAARGYPAGEPVARGQAGDQGPRRARRVRGRHLRQDGPQGGRRRVPDDRLLNGRQRFQGRNEGRRVLGAAHQGHEPAQLLGHG